MSKSSTNRALISVATAFIAGLLLTPAVASAEDNPPVDRTQFKRECAARGGVFTEGKTSDGRTIWLCVKNGVIIANCDLDDEGYGGCAGPADWPLKVDDPPAGSGGRHHWTGPAQHREQGPNSPPTSGGTGSGPLGSDPAQHLSQVTSRAVASP